MIGVVWYYYLKASITNKQLVKQLFFVYIKIIAVEVSNFLVIPYESLQNK